MKRIKLTLAAGLFVVALAGPSRPAAAQGMPPGFSPAELEKRVKEALDNSPEQTVEYKDLIKITYKSIPSSPAEIVKRDPQLAGQLPPGFDIDALAKQYGPMIQQYLDRYLADIAKLEVLVDDVKFRSKELPKGTYTLGLVFNGADIKGAIVSGGELKKPIEVPFKSATLATPADTLTFEVVEDEKEAKKGNVGFRIVASFAKSKGGSSYPFTKK